MIIDPSASPGTRFLFVTACFVIVTAGMRAAAPILVPFLLALFIALISAPPLFWLRDKGIPKGPALLLVIMVVVSVSLAMAAIMDASLNDFSDSLPTYQRNLQQTLATLRETLGNYGIVLPTVLVDDVLDPRMAGKLMASVLSSLSTAVTNTFFVLLMAIFILLEASGFPAKLRRAFAGSSAPDSQVNKLVSNVKHYILLKTVVSIATGAFVAVWLAVIGVHHYVLWGVLAFVLNYVPNIGSIIAAVPAVLLAFIQGGLELALGASIAYVLVNIVVGNIIEPRVMGRGLGLSALVVMLSLVFWGWVLGPVGMLLSIPLTMVIKIALEGHDQTRWVGVLLGPETEPRADE